MRPTLWTSSGHRLQKSGLVSLFDQQDYSFGLDTSDRGAARGIAAAHGQLCVREATVRPAGPVPDHQLGSGHGTLSFLATTTAQLHSCALADPIYLCASPAAWKGHE